MRSGGETIEGVDALTEFVRRWQPALDANPAPAVVFALPGGDARHVNPAARARFGAPTLDHLLPDAEERCRLRELLDEGLAWEGVGRDGLWLVGFPVPGEGRVEGVCLEARTGPLAATLTRAATRARAAEQELSRMRREARWREAEHRVAMGIGQGLPLGELAMVAAAEIESLLHAAEVRVSLIEDDALRVLVGRRDGAAIGLEPRVLVGSSPATLARAKRAPVQRIVATSQDEFPALHALELDGIRAVLYAPVEVAEAVFGFIEVYGAVRDVFLPEEVELVSSVARMLATALIRERVLEQVARHARAMELRAALGREELDRTQEQLIQAAKLSSIGELAAGLVHELNQPLNVLGGYVELLREGSLGENARDRALDVMSRAVERMSSMVDNLRNFARGGAPSATAVDIAAVVNMARELTVGALKRGVQVSCPPGLTVLGDPNRLEQVIINLVANALQCDGDPVSVHAFDLDEERIAVEVRDRGPGVPEALRQRIFEPFFTTKPPGQGTGLGLSVSGRIIQAHGGRIEVDDHEGGGAIFRLVLPRYRPRGSEAPS